MIGRVLFIFMIVCICSSCRDTKQQGCDKLKNSVDSDYKMDNEVKNSCKSNTQGELVGNWCVPLDDDELMELRADGTLTYYKGAHISEGIYQWKTSGIWSYDEEKSLLKIHYIDDEPNDYFYLYVFEIYKDNMIVTKADSMGMPESDRKSTLMRIEDMQLPHIYCPS